MLSDWVVTKRRRRKRRRRGRNHGGRVGRIRRIWKEGRGVEHHLLRRRRWRRHWWWLASGVTVCYSNSSVWFTPRITSRLGRRWLILSSTPHWFTAIGGGGSKLTGSLILQFLPPLHDGIHCCREGGKGRGRITLLVY